ncbi:nucleotidyltransferase domain-containing protein [Pseudoduganella chitinolytica]|uniref:Nucleotidyltransferase family protein n=1 Tax=Pseudoduganella chitinolytica TaxID=34070 RepID=A0ABY8BAK0_9BURK|nr:nucleotidyltransferase family protein [Pseudoduganella chitinolytica]WEF31792.1 nucleotidyltransferase family protein [Pseudoduganella chitinolytica]
MAPLAPLLLHALRAPADTVALADADWDLLLRQAGAANLLATLGYILAEHGVLDRIPVPARDQLAWAQVLARRHRQAVRWEIRLIRLALRELGLPTILLKGAAYCAAGLPPAQGRLFSDIDILVPETHLAEAEAALMLAGWAGTHHDAYDQRYYREWMHELPPMQHTRRESMIDVHHAILPRTAAARPDSALLQAAAVAVPGEPALRVLAPVDMVLHSAVHLFTDGEFNNGLRDLVDLQRLLAHYGQDARFWARLVPRAHELELARPLFYALRYTALLLGTEVPPAVSADIAAAAPSPLLLRLMDELFRRALLPVHDSCGDRFSATARGLLYLRGNWLRMPPLLLARHLLHKAFLSPRKARQEAA